MHQKQCDAPDEGKKIYTHTPTSEKTLLLYDTPPTQSGGLIGTILTEYPAEFIFNVSAGDILVCTTSTRYKIRPVQTLTF
jgi:hypothetical protein